MTSSRCVKKHLLAFSICTALSLNTAAIAAAQESISVELEPAPLASALNQLSFKSGIVIIAPGRLVNNIKAPALNGNYEIDEALEKLLFNSGLEAVKQTNGAFVIKKRGPQMSLTPKDTAVNGAPIDEIVVSATKRDTNLMDVSAAVSALNTQQIQDAGVTDFKGLVDALPGISINSAFGGANNSFITIRGIGGADDYKPNGNPSVALHVDGIYQTSNAYLGMPLFDLERIEVLKGPQGTLYGRNTTAGVINAITKRPTDEFEGYASVEYGSYEYTQGEAAFGGSVSDNLKVRIATKFEQGGGYMDGKGAGLFAGYVPEGFEGVIPAVTDPGERDGFGDKDLFAFRATGVYTFQANTDLTLRYFMSSDNGDTLQYDRIALENETGSGISRNAGENDDPYAFYADEYYRHTIDIEGVNGELAHQIDTDLNVNVLFGYQESERNMGGNGDGTSFPRYKYAFDETLDQSSLEIRFSDSQGGDIDWIAGVFYVSDSVDFVSDWTSFAVRSQYTSPYSQTRNSFATFANVDWFVNNDLKLSAGVRYTQDTAKFSGYNQDLDPWGTSIYEEVFNSPGLFSWDRDFDDNNVSGKLTAQYYLSDNLNIFASIGNGYRAGGFDGTSIFSLEETEPFDSETVDSFELGLRYTDESLSASVDLFAYDFEEMQATTRLSNDTNGRTNVGAAEVRGAEASFNAQLLNNGEQQLTFNSSVTYLDTEITEFSSNRVDDVQNTVGDPLPGSPELSYSISLNHSIFVATNRLLSTRLTYTYHDEETNRLNAGAGNTVPDYGLLNINMDLELGNGFTAFAYGRNITDEEYFLELNAGARLVGAPATYGVGVRTTF